jgi:hypothetical protein
MAKNEKTSERVGKLAAKGLAGIHLTKKDMRSVFSSALTQRPDGVKKRTISAGPHTGKTWNAPGVDYPVGQMAAKKKPKKAARRKAVVKRKK